MKFIFFLSVSYFIYLFLRFFIRLFSRLLFRHLTNKMKENMNNTRKRPASKKNEGEVTIDKMPNKTKPSKNNVGDYVDYEEVE